MPFPSNMLEISVALLYKPYGMGKRDDVVENEALRSLTYPVRLVLWAACMCLFYPIMLATALLTALVLRLTSGTAADVLRHSLSASFKTGASYPCLFVFKKPLADQARLRAAWKELAAEVGMNPARVGIDFPEEVPRPFPEGAAVEADHYVDRGVSLFKRACVVMGGWHAYIEVNNGAPGAPTTMRCYFPGHTFDGTSCFNLGKELVNRYYGERNKIVIQSTLTKAADAALRDASFAQYLARVPYNVLLNTSDFNWMLLRSQRFFGGPGLSFELAMLNYTVEQSARLNAGLRRRGAKPFAGFIYAAFQAYKHVEGANPYALTSQASMAARCYEPESGVSGEEWTKGRRFVGDWLIGCLHHFQRTGDFTLSDAQRVYEQLISDLARTEGSVIPAAMAKAYCPIGGAAVYEFFPFYADRMRVMDGIFFNNYGIRSIHEDAELFSYNWGAPFRLGFNTLHVNGKTCICLASSHMSLTKLRRARDKADEVLSALMD